MKKDESKYVGFGDRKFKSKYVGFDEIRLE